MGKDFKSPGKDTEWTRTDVEDKEIQKAFVVGTAANKWVVFRRVKGAAPTLMHINEFCKVYRQVFVIKRGAE